MPLDGDLRRRIGDWIEADPDPVTRATAQTMLASGNEAALLDCFGARLQFGTAGLRGPLGPGPNRMNRLVVRQAAAGLADYLLERDVRTADRGVVIGFDARHGSAAFALDTACVLAARGVRALLVPPHVPTPLLAWSITDLDAAAGVMVTASHNPPQDNGYKVYLDDGAQIVSPHDSGISRRIDEAGLHIEVAPPSHTLIERVGDDVIDRYLDAAAAVRLRRDVGSPLVVSTALHGVGGALLARAFERAGFAAPVVVVAQQEPDADFPTTPFPNPEEPGAMDAVVTLARERSADLAIANDPDADRMGVAIPGADGSWRVLSGDEVGWLLAEHILTYTSGTDRLVITTLVSSSMLSRMAHAHGVHHRETFTGFKWIGRTVLDHPELRFVFGYEQALGYLVTRQPLDKDGISAAVLMAEIAACAVADGVTMEQRLLAIRQRYGNLRTVEGSVRMAPSAAAARVDALAASPPRDIAGRRVTSVEEFPEAGLLRLWCGRARLQLRPSGTEPKVKLYVEVEDDDPEPLLAGLERVITR